MPPIGSSQEGPGAMRVAQAFIIDGLDLYLPITLAAIGTALTSNGTKTIEHPCNCSG